MTGLVGSWLLISYRVAAADGAVHEPLGANPQGLGVYTAEGTMSAQLMAGDRQGFGRSFRPGAAVPTDLLAAAGRGYIAYCGTYEVEDQSDMVLHHVQCSLVPDWVGTVMKRAFLIEGDILTLRPPAWAGEQAELRWRRTPTRTVGLAG